MEKLFEIGTQLGLTGPELRAWINTQRAEQSAERAAEREKGLRKLRNEKKRKGVKPTKWLGKPLKPLGKPPRRQKKLRRMK